MKTLKIGRRGQITLPSPMRHELNLKEGDKILVSVRDSEIVLRPAGPCIFDLRGSVTVSGPQDFEAIRTEVLGHVAAKATGRDA